MTKRHPTDLSLVVLGKDTSPETLSGWRNSLPRFAQLALISMQLREVSMDLRLTNEDFSLRKPPSR